MEEAVDRLGCIQYVQIAPYRVHCKLCGRTIVKADKTPEYAEVMLYFSDGSRHHTCLCDACSSTKDTALLQAIHTADMLRLEDIGMNVSNLCTRRVISAERIL
jgi:hypothetical protein